MVCDAHPTGRLRVSRTRHMLPTLVLSLALTPGGDPLSPSKFPTAYVQSESPYGFCYSPASTTDALPRWPATYYDPQPGDVLLLSNTTLAWSTLYAAAGTWKPGHAAVVVRMPDG